MCAQPAYFLLLPSTAPPARCAVLPPAEPDFWVDSDIRFEKELISFIPLTPIHPIINVHSSGSPTYMAAVIMVIRICFMPCSALIDCRNYTLSLHDALPINRKSVV